MQDMKTLVLFVYLMVVLNKYGRIYIYSKSTGSLLECFFWYHIVRFYNNKIILWNI